MASVTASKGYAATTVADLLSAAGVSRETFYEQFESKLDCFEQAFEDAAELLFRFIADSADGSGAVDSSPSARFDRLLGAYLEGVASFPDLARLCLVEAYAAGPTMARRRSEVQERFADQMAALLDAHDDTAHFACRALVASIGGMVATRLALGDVEGIRSLREPFAGLVRTTLCPRFPDG
jgi:AcrR family transcriptional regulator